MRGSLTAALMALLIVTVASVSRSSSSTDRSSMVAGAAPVLSPDDLSCKIPGDVEEPVAGENAEINFDRYAWKAFVALICTADENKRGVAAGPQTFTAGPRVFQTYKSSWEVFPSSKKFSSNPPDVPDWDHYAGPNFNPCGQQVSAGQLTLGAASKFPDIAQAGRNTNPHGPIVAKNSAYAHYLIQFNDVAFDKIRNDSLYLASRVSNGVTFPVGSITLKSAWIATVGLPEQERNRYYHTMAWVQSPVPDDHGSCSYEEVALIALHIVQKTPSRQTRIWASFEHEDNAPPFFPAGASTPQPSSAPDGSYLFFDPAKGRMPQDNPLEGKPFVRNPEPFNIENLKPINTNAATDRDYAAALRAKLGSDTPWAHYRIAVVQRYDCPNCSGDSFTPSPYSPWSWANPVAETFFQLDQGGSCIACHKQAVGDDFVWSLRIDSYPDFGRN
jgi:hypothetical protein